MRKSLPKMSWAVAWSASPARLQQPDLEHLARVVPLVDGRVDVQALVALEADEPGPERGREDLRELRLADAGLAFEQERPPEFERQEDRRRQRAVRDVVALAEVDLDGLDGAGAGGPVVAVGHRANLHARAPAGVGRPGSTSRLR